MAVVVLSIVAHYADSQVEEQSCTVLIQHVQSSTRPSLFLSESLRHAQHRKCFRAPRFSRHMRPAKCIYYCLRLTQVFRIPPNPSVAFRGGFAGLNIEDSHIGSLCGTYAGESSRSSSKTHFLFWLLGFGLCELHVLQDALRLHREILPAKPAQPSETFKRLAKAL